ncbi:hypothetical protein ACIRPX_24380 [Streptomyces sp. NPDC101225]|uniref:hypothetical protein n=1 Tax=Streptomyces sp. NPDC101225 TaxID=3366135 RepID=UPI00381AF5AA
MADTPSEESRPESGAEPGSAPRPGSGPDPVSDDVWQKFVEDSERDIHTSSAPKEPSARARMVTERLRKMDEEAARQDAKGRTSGKSGRKRGGGDQAAADPAWQPEGWRTGPAWREMDGRAARRRRLWGMLGVPVAAALAVVAVKPSLIPGDPFGTGRAEAEATAPPLPPETARPTAAPSAAALATPTLDRPFAGSPAARWADGTAGIVLPEATPVGSLTKAQVNRALQQTKALLVGANLDRGTLLGGRPDAALAVLDPRQPEMLGDVKGWLRKPDKRHDPVWLFSRFDPHEVRLVGDVVKTRGRMTFKAGRHASVVVHADYTFVYPLAPAGKGSTEVTRTIVRRVLDMEMSDPRKYQVTPGKLSIVKYDEDIGNSACDVYDGFLHPAFTSSEPAGAAPTGPTTDPYDRSKDLDENRAEGCGTVSRV